MSETPDSPESIESSDAPAPETPEKPSSDLQFDRAEVPVAKRCRMCNQPIGETFFRIEGKTICAPCQEKVNAQLTGGSGTERFLKASLYGTLAAVLGAGVYYAILAATGYELALISIGIGIIVGMAVKKGCGGRGGWVYQTLAIFLTYSAIASAYVPIVFGEFMKHRADKPAAHTATKATEVKPAASDAESETEAETPEPATTAPKPHMNIFLALILLAGFLFALPIIAGFHSIIGLFIIGVGLYEAWKINKRVVLKITGPFPASAALAPAGPAPRILKRAQTGG